MIEALQQHPTIDPEFRALIPPLSSDERALLEENIVRDGCRDPLVLWNGILLDGHNRYDICAELGLPFRTVSVELDSRAAAEDWIDTNQLGRRNLSPESVHLLRGRRFERMKKMEGRPEKLPQSEGVIGETSERLATKYGVSRATIERDGQLARAVETLKPHVPDIEQRVMTGDIQSLQSIVDAAGGLKRCGIPGHIWIADLPECPYCTKTPQERIQALNADVVSKPHVSNNSGNNEWYTPRPFIDAARGAMGTIHTDPASSAIANKTVGAETFYTTEDDGLTKPWKGNVWMNPPYAQPLVAQFSEAVSEKFDTKEIKSACVLVNNATETAWFQRMLMSAAAVCFLRSRVRFLDPFGEPSGAPLQGQAVIYMGKDPYRFARSFADLGCVLMKDAV